MTTSSMNISLPENLKKQVESRIIEGDFSNSSDYVRHLIRQDLGKKGKEEILKPLVLDGLNSGISEKNSKQIFSDIKDYIKTS